MTDKELIPGRVYKIDMSGTTGIFVRLDPKDGGPVFKDQREPNGEKSFVYDMYPNGEFSFTGGVHDDWELA